MAKKRYTADQIINKLREVEVDVGRGTSIQEAVRKIEVTENTYYRWRKEYGGLKHDQARRLKELEKENVRLKRVIADQALDIAVLKDFNLGKL